MPRGSLGIKLSKGFVVTCTNPAYAAPFIVRRGRGRKILLLEHNKRIVSGIRGIPLLLSVSFCTILLKVLTKTRLVLQRSKIR